MKESNQNLLENHKEEIHVVIVGGGLAGLTAARHLLQSSSSSDNRRRRRWHITLVEAQGRLGGRVCANTTFLPGYALDIGAEFIHCTDTLLTRAIVQDYKICPSQEEFEPYFVTAHADGGPDDAPTRDGKYGMYYVDGSLLMYNDSRLQPLKDALESVMTMVPPKDSQGEESSTSSSPKTNDMSVAEALEGMDLEPALQRLAVAGYGNTAGSTDMRRLSLSMLAKFEQYWDQHETEGDYRLPAHLGMTSVVDALAEDITKDERMTIYLDWPVQTIGYNSASSSRNKVVLQGRDNKCLEADAVICTAPPRLLPDLLPSLLTGAQLETLGLIGFETVLKVILKFKQRPWPEYLQSVVWADGGPMPETWFRNDFVVEGETYHIMVGYLASDVADNFLDDVEQRAQQQSATREKIVTEICLEQLSNIFPKETLHDAHVDTLVHAWNAATEPYTPGGYMYPYVGLKTLTPLAEPCKGGRVVLAGEATNTNACCTLQSAMETGVRAAKQLIEMVEKEFE